MTEALLAGVLDPRAGAQGEWLARALGGGEDLRVESHGPLTLASRAAAVEMRGGVLCALEGAVYHVGGGVARAGSEVGNRAAPDAAAPAAAPAGSASGAASPPAAAVLGSAWRRLGDEFVEQIRGDFALVLWDGEAGRGLLARDHLGGRTMVWHRDGERLLFATEIRQLLALLGRTPEPDHAAVAHWLAISGMPDDRSLYAGVRRLGAGHLLPLGDPSAAPRRYWRPGYREPLRASRDELADVLRERLSTAVRRRLPGPGEGAVMLSGGLDSATVAGLASRAPAEEGRPRRAYSATFPQHPSVDEAALIERLCSAFGLTSAQAVVRSGSVTAGALPYLERWRVPPVSPNLFFWSPLLSRAAADGVRFMIDGEGGDELFGLAPTLIADRLRRGRVRAGYALVRRIPGADGRPHRSSVRRIVRQYGWKAATPAPLHRAVRALRGAGTYAPPWFTEASAREFAATDDQAGWKEARGPRWWAYLVDVTIAGMGPSLVYDHARRRALLAGLEPPRHPLMDVDVVELVLQLPPELAFDAHVSRPLLRHAMAGLLPDEVRLRPSKSTFDALFHESLAGADLPVVRELLGDPAAEVGAYVDLPAMREELLDRPPPQGRALTHWAVHTWRLVTAECWLRSLADPGFPARLAGEAGLRSAELQLVERAASV